MRIDNTRFIAFEIHFEVDSYVPSQRVYHSVLILCSVTTVMLGLPSLSVCTVLRTNVYSAVNVVDCT